MEIEQQYIQAVNQLLWERVRNVLFKLSQEKETKQVEFGNGLLLYEQELQQVITVAERNAKLLPYEYLFMRFACDDFERHVIWLLAMFDLDRRFLEAAEFIHGSLGIHYITPFLAQVTFSETFSNYETYYAFQKESVLGRVFVDMMETESGESLKQLRLKSWVKSFLCHGSIADGPDINYLKVYGPEESLDEFCGSAKGVDQLVQVCQNLPADEAGIAIRLIGSKGIGRKFTIRHLAKQLDFSCVFFLLEEVNWGEIDSQLEHFIFETKLLGALPVICGEQDLYYQSDNYKEKMKMLWHRLWQEFRVILSTADEVIYDQQDRDKTSFMTMTLAEPALLEAKVLWEQKSKRYPLAAAVAAGEMGNKFQLTPGKIEAALVAADGYRRCDGSAQITQEMLNRGCRSVLKQQYNSKIVKIDAQYIWDQLVLPDAQLELLRAACAQVTHKHLVYGTWGMNTSMVYGRGISMVFAGSPGTGKTMAAQVLATEMGLELYKVELAAVVSKYIGETEKNLAEIFEQARQGQFILFFDEADVLFAKRTEVRDSHDKYSNMEAAFMLQKMEEYEGITILATNYLQNIDEAFKRRIKFMIDFPFPDQDSRKLLWMKALPVQMPVEELDFDYLSRFQLTGSNIKNIVVHSAFLAAAKGKITGMKEILLGVRNEFAKNGKMLTREELGEYFEIL